MKFAIRAVAAIFFLLPIVKASPAEGAGKNAALAAFLDTAKQTAQTMYTTKEKLVSIRETTTFALDNDVIVIVKFGRERVIKLDTEEMIVNEVVQTLRVRISDLKPDVGVEKRWKTMFDANVTGTKRAAIELRCARPACTERSESTANTCLTGCSNTNVPKPTETKEFADIIHVPMSSLAEAKRVSAHLAYAIGEGSQEKH